MRIAFLGNFGVDYSSETHHKKSLEALGHEVICLQENSDPMQVVFNEAASSDMFIWVHTHGWTIPRMGGEMTAEQLLLTLKDMNIPTVTYHLDLWFGLERQKDLEVDPIYKNIEYFFTCDKLMADWFNKETNVKGVYLPAGVFQEDMKLDMDAPKTNDIIFVGSRGYHHEWPYRPRLIDWLKATYGDRFTHVGGDGSGVVRGAALTNLYNSTKVVVGDSLVIGFDYPYYWSDRLYETAGRGGFQIFPQIKGIENEYNTQDYPNHPTELVTYEFDNFSMLKKKIDYYLEHDEEREAIRKAAYTRTLKEHTYLSRWKTIIEEVTQ